MQTTFVYPIRYKNSKRLGNNGNRGDNYGVQ
jgi:hypothetical protein